MKGATAILLVATAVVSFAAGGLLVHSQAPREPKIDNLLQHPLAQEFVPDREVIVSYVEIPPHTTMERHWHPGEEFQYYLEGRGDLMVDGQPSAAATAGKVGHVPYKKLHTIVTKEEGLKAVVFRVHTKGEPVRYLEKGGTAEK